MQVQLFGGHKMGGQIRLCTLNFMCANMHFIRVQLFTTKLS